MKIYKKIKERERQQRKEELKTKIIGKQQILLKETCKHRNIVDYSSSNIIPSESSNSLDNESVVKVRIRCISKEENVQKRKCSEATAIKSDDDKLSKTKYDEKSTIQITESDRIHCEQNYFNTTSDPIIGSQLSKESKQNISKYLIKNSHLAERGKQNLRIQGQMKPVTLIQDYPVGVPILLNHIGRSKSVTSDPTGNMRTQSTLSARSSVNFAHKSCKLYTHTHTCTRACMRGIR